MSLPITSRSLRILLLIVFLIGCAGLAQQAGRTSAHSTAAAPLPTVGAPLRLRLKVEHTRLSEGQTINIWADFLDGDYNQVLNDGTRVVKFEIAGPRGATGSISPSQPVTVTPGEKSAKAKFTPGHQGRVLIRASSEGLDSDETFLLVTKPAASFLTQVLGLFETVAYAQDSEEFGFLLLKPKTQAGSQAKFQISFSGTLPADSTIRISTDPPATINYGGQNFEGFKEIPVKEISSGKGGMSDSIIITSENVGEVEVRAAVRPNGPRAFATAIFSPPSPSRIIFDDDLQDIPSTQTAIPISIHLADDKGRPIQSDGTRNITFKRASEDDPVEFESPSVVFLPNQKSAGTMLHLKALPRGNQLTLFAVSQGDNGWIKGGPKTIFIKGPIEVMLYWLVFAALAGGLVGGVVRHIPKDYKLKHILPKWTGECWDLGLVGRIVGSVVCGLFLYLTMKLGLSRMIGSPVLPAGIDLGTKLVAFFFGGIGGFAGTVVFDRLVSWCLPSPQTVKKAALPSGAKQPAQT